MSNTTSPTDSAPRISRRDFLGLATSAAAVGYAPLLAKGSGQAGSAIRALVPRDQQGHHFVLYSDSTSGSPGSPSARNLQAVNAVVARIQPQPEFVAFPGDAIVGVTADYDELRRQWDYWYNSEMKWLEGKGIPLFQSTSNHNTYDYGSERIFRDVHPAIPQNGPDDQKGLAYFIRRGNLLYVSTHQPRRPPLRRVPDYRPDMLIDSEWLNQVLTTNEDAEYKLVAGHYPAFPVNGYAQDPRWCLKPEERQPFWDVLVKHKIDAYLTSHIIAFDVQVHEGVLQILSGGAGTIFGPGGFMPGRTEYHHAVQIAIDGTGVRYQVLDIQADVRESLLWPFSLAPSESWEPLDADNAPPRRSRARAAMIADVWKGIVAWRFRGELGRTKVDQQAATLLYGWGEDGPATVWIGFEGNPPQLTVRLIPEPTYGSQTWTGPTFEEQSAFDFQVALHPGMGPGGVLFRTNDSSPWTSLSSTSARGAEILRWPTRAWAVGTGQSGPTDRPFQGSNLKVTWTHRNVPTVW